MSATCVASRLASTTTKNLCLEGARAEILEFRKSKTEECKLMTSANPWEGPAIKGRDGYFRLKRASTSHGQRSSVSETWNTSSQAPGWMKPQEPRVSNSEGFLVGKSQSHSWLPAQRSPDDPRIVMTRASPKTKYMGMLDSEDWFAFPANPAAMQFHIDHSGMWPVKRDVTTSVREEEWLVLRTAFYDAAPDGCVPPEKIREIVKRVFSTLASQKLTGIGCSHTTHTHTYMPRHFM